MSCMTSLRLPPVRDRASGMPWPSAIAWCLEPVLPRPAGLGPVSGRPSAPAAGTADHRRRPIQHARGMQLNRQKPVQLLPYSGLMPVPQPPSAGHARAGAELLRQELPGNPGAEHKQDARQDLCGHPGACGPDDRHGAARPAATARSAPATHPARSAVAARPSSRDDQPEGDYPYSWIIFRTVLTRQETSSTPSDGCSAQSRSLV
jgi:hypothetical protein